MNASRIPIVPDCCLNGKVLLVRMDHNVVKKGKIKDTMRIDRSIPTLQRILKAGGLPIIMTHVGRPKDKKTGMISLSDEEAVTPIVEYLDQRLGIKGYIPTMIAEDEYGITDLSPLKEALANLKNGEAGYIYLPNTRWFKGEEAKDGTEDAFARDLASYADFYVNDAFGSWQAHASTYAITKYLPSYAGLLMMQEIENLDAVLQPKRPMLAVVAGAKFDTKIGPLSSLIESCDHLVLGGVIYNAWLAHKYGLKIKGVSEEDIAQAAKFASEIGDKASRIVEPKVVVESESIESREDGSWRFIKPSELEAGTNLAYILDAAPIAFTDKVIKSVFLDASTIFVNAVMGYTTLFGEGTEAMYRLINQNKTAKKIYGGGDTIQDFKALLPEIFASATKDESYYFFTGGGAVLNAIEQGSPYGMKPVAALIKE